MKPGSPTAPRNPSFGTCWAISILSQYIQKDNVVEAKFRGTDLPSVSLDGGQGFVRSKHLDESAHGTSLCNLTVVTTLGVFCSILQFTRHFHRHICIHLH